MSSQYVAASPGQPPRAAPGCACVTHYLDLRQSTEQPHTDGGSVAGEGWRGQGAPSGRSRDPACRGHHFHSLSLQEPATPHAATSTAVHKLTPFVAHVQHSVPQQLVCVSLPRGRVCAHINLSRMRSVGGCQCPGPCCVAEVVPRGAWEGVGLAGGAGDVRPSHPGPKGHWQVCPSPRTPSPTRPTAVLLEGVQRALLTVS